MNNFDKNIKKKLYNSQMPVSDGLWASIESQIPVKKEQPKYWLLFLMCACTISFAILTTNNNEKTSNQSAQVVPTESLKATKVISQKVLQNFSSGHSAYVNSSDNEQLSESLVIQSSEPYSNVKENQTLSSFKKKSAYSTNTAKNTKTNQEIQFNSTPLIPNDLSAISSTKKLKFVNNPFKKYTVNQSNKSVFKLIEKSRIYRSAEPQSKLAALNDNFYNRGIASSDNIDLADYGITLDKYSVAACPSFEPYRTGLYFYADITTGYNVQMLESASQEFDLVALRNSKEQNSVSISANLGLGKQWSSGFLLETGLNYDRINIRSDQYNNDIPPRLMITIDSVLTPTGWQISRDSTYIAHEGDGKVKNNFTQFNIPVIFGYETFISDRLSLVAKAGILVNISSRNSGQIQISTGDLVSYDSDNIATSMFKTNLGIAYTGSLHLQTEFTPLLSGYTGVNVNYYPDNFALQANTVKQTYARAGLTVGLKYSL